jgi:hypothetical protein
MDIEYKHEMTVDANSWFIRLYVWMWEAKRSDINFCKLFWGYFPVFFLLNLVVFQLMIRPVIWLVGELLDLLPERERPTELQKSIKLREERLVKQEKARLKDDRGPSLPQRFLSGVGVGASLHHHAHLAVLGMGDFAQDGELRRPASDARYRDFAQCGRYRWDHLPRGRELRGDGNHPRRHRRGDHRRAVHRRSALPRVLAKMANVSSAGWKKTKEGSKGFWEVMVNGFIAVKSNTCPKINLSDEERRAA